MTAAPCRRWSGGGVCENRAVGSAAAEMVQYWESQVWWGKMAVTILDEAALGSERVLQAGLVRPT